MRKKKPTPLLVYSPQIQMQEIPGAASPVSLTQN